MHYLFNQHQRTNTNPLFAVISANVNKYINTSTTENRENQNYSRTRVQFVHAFKVESSVEFNRLHRESQFHFPDNCVFAGGQIGPR